MPVSLIPVITRKTMCTREGMIKPRNNSVRTWFAPHNPTIVGDADIFGNLIPGRIWSGGLSKNLKALPFKEIQSKIIKLMPGEFKTCTTKEEKERAILLILECLRETRAEEPDIRGSEGARSKRFMAETLDKDGCLTVAHRDYTGAFERLFEELHGRNYEVRFMRNFCFDRSRGSSDPSFKGEKYAVSFIAPEGYASSQKERGEKEAKKEKIEKVKKAVVAEFVKEGSFEKWRGLVDQLFNEVLCDTLLKTPSKRIAEQIKKFQAIDSRIKVWDDYKKDDAGNPTNETFIRVGIKGRRSTKLLAGICGVVKDAGGDIQSLTIESIESENKSVCAFNVVDTTGKPIKEIKFDVIRKGILDLAQTSLGLASLVDTIVGPRMVPTSSSHTCGANRIARTILEIITAGFKAGFLDSNVRYSLRVEMLNSFDLTTKGSGKGHYSDEAVAAGLLGVRHDDLHLIGARDKLKENSKAIEIKLDNKAPIKIGFTYESFVSRQDASFPDNPIKIILEEKDSNGKHEHVFIGESIGGGAIQIYQIFGAHCNLTKKTEFEPIKGNTPTYLISRKEGQSVQALIKAIEKLGYKLVNRSSLETDSPETVICLGGRMTDEHFQKIVTQVGKIAEVGLISDVLYPYEAPFSDFDTLKTEAIRSGKNISEIAIEYEAGVKKKSKRKVRREMDALRKTMFKAMENGLKNKKDIFCPRQDANEKTAAETDEPGRGIEANVYKMAKNATNFPLAIEEFAEILKSAFALEKKNSDHFMTKYGPPPMSEEEKKDHEQWSFIITAPLCRAIYDRKQGKTVLKEKSARGEISPDDSFVKDLYDEFVASWKATPTVSNIYTTASTNAIAVAEWNARRGLIVAGPTAGACGVIPGVLKAMKDYYKYSNEELFSPERLTEALFTAGLVGLLFSDKLRMNGGTAGCQAEIGVASAMAAAAATELMGGSPEDVMHAVALALKALEGLVCTPIGGFVAYPCIARNGFGAVIALTAAVLATNKYKSALSPDAVMEGYIDVADKMHVSLRERGTGGIAISDEGRALGKWLKSCKLCQ